MTGWVFTGIRSAPAHEKLLLRLGGHCPHLPDASSASAVRTAMARVLVTGARGFVGSHAIPILLSRGHDVVAVGRSEHEGDRRGRERWVSCDLLSEGAASNLIVNQQPSHLLHLAWDTTPGRFWNDAANLDWLAASLRLFRAFARHGGRRIVGVGTCAEYDWNCSLLSENETPIAPRTLYGAAKAALGSTYALAAAVEGVSFAWARLFFLYGPGEKRGRLTSGLFATLMDSQIARVSHGRQERDFMHVFDAAAALVALLESNVTGPVNVATGECRPLADLISGVAEAIGRPELVRYGAVAVPSDEPPRLAASAIRLRDEVLFTPRFDLRSGISDTYRWWRTQSDSLTRSEK